MPDPPSRPPIAPALPELTNAIALGLSKQAALLASLRSKHRPSQPTTTSTTTTTTTKKGFSSLTTTTTPLSSASIPTPSPHQPKPNDDLNPSFLAPPNAGIGQAPPSSSNATAATTAKDAETRQLARKILGRNAARQVQEAKDARAAGGRGVKRRGGGGAAAESESEEELGRSAVGRARARGSSSKPVAGDKGKSGDGVVDTGGKAKGEADEARAEVVEPRTKDVELVLRGESEDKRIKKKRKKNKTAVRGEEA
ncbi:hypothetical protein QBC39DRAFT_75456 [Podospora conica]|nr:hypothetical protein QBC39DRAFT_75456 [Schizothecium conicum]